MTDAIFRGDYARLYDAMYGGKDYGREIAAVEGAVAWYGDGGAYRSLLDLGCGTGNHAVPLARRGYDVTGVDLSPDMVAIARRKASDAGVTATFESGDMRDVALGRPFDVAVIMFAALGYLISDADVTAALTNVRRHLRRGGVLMLDVWHGPTLLREGARDRITVADEPGRQLIKASLRTLDPSRRYVNVRMRVWDIAGTTVAATADETHRMRPFSRPELERFLRDSGLAPRAFFAFPDLDTNVDETTFDLGCVAVAE